MHKVAQLAIDAQHEAGHCVTALALGFTVESVVIGLDPDANNGERGLTIAETGPAFDSLPEAEKDDVLAMLFLAGHAAESFVREDGWYPNVFFKETWGSGRLIYGDNVDVHGIIARRTAADPAFDSNAWLVTAITRTFEIVNRETVAIWKVARLLLQKRTLSAEDLEPITFVGRSE